eukprot:TCONS_00060543-protein
MMFWLFFALLLLIDKAYCSSLVSWSKPVNRSIAKLVDGKLDQYHYINIKYGRFTRQAKFQAVFPAIKSIIEDLSVNECLDSCNDTPGCVMVLHNTGNYKVCSLFDKTCRNDEFFCVAGGTHHTLYIRKNPCDDSSLCEHGSFCR